MVAIRLSATIGEDRKLVLELPPDTPTGPVALLIRPLQETQQTAHELLLAAGVLSPGARPSEDLIDEDRARSDSIFRRYQRPGEA
jgi:hypothetical protein